MSEWQFHLDDNQAKAFFCDGVEECYSLTANPQLEDSEALWNQ